METEKLPQEGNFKQITSLKQIRTYQGDVASALKNQNESLVSIQRAEQAKLERATPLNTEEVAREKKTRKDFFLLFMGTILLVVLGVVGAWYAYTEFLSQQAPPNIEIPENRFFFTNSSEEILVGDTTRQEFIRALAQSLSDISESGIKHVVLEETVLDKDFNETVSLLSTQNFLDKLDVRAQGSLVRAFEPLFMLGAYNENVFLIINIESFENTYAGMLQWERYMAEDIGPIFSTAPLLRGLDGNQFEDVIIKNKDVRALSVEVPPIREGEATTTSVVLLYSYFDNNKIMITDNTDVLETVVERLTREKLSR